MPKLTDKKCLPCEGGVALLDRADAEARMAQLHPDWKLNTEGVEISRKFKFKGYNQTMVFVNAVAWIAEAEDHHPDLNVGWGACTVHYSTHAISGLSENDFICAAKIDALMKQ